MKFILISQSIITTSEPPEKTDGQKICFLQGLEMGF